ncbi:MAG TPA: response regulator [Candidatus Eremiobacteraceae bacterium]|nr:response regulator [Candidatus Eremiobacteraceae bacterium]
MELSPAELAELQTVFKAECDEHLSALNDLLMSLERRPDDAESLNETFRRVHSVKGAARMVGLAGIEAIAHALETMLAPVRDGKRKLERRELDMLFEGTDAITVFMSTASGTSTEDPKVRELLAKMAPANGHSNGASTKPASESKADTPVPTASPEGPKSTPASAIELAVENVAGGEMVRIPADKIDKLIALRGELVRALTVEEDELKSLSALVDSALEDIEEARRKAIGDAAQMNDATTSELRRRREQLRTALSRMAERNARRTSGLEELRDSLADLRMLPAGTILQGMHRIVRDVALNQSKEADLTIAGGDVPIDKVILDALKEPLIHLVRNAVAHGLESSDVRAANGKPRSGNVRISVSTGTSSATITVEDDGGGIDFERVRDSAIANNFATTVEAEQMTEAKLVSLLFKPGFSTARSADQFSGRGVGLDVVADRIAQLHGSYTVESVLGKGMRVSLRVPVSLLTSSVLTVKAGTHEVCLRQTEIREAVLLKPEDVVNVDGRINATVRGEVMPVVPLASIAGGDNEVFFTHDGVKPAIVIEFGERAAALVVDSLEGVSDVIVKPLPKPLGQLAGIAGCAILGNGIPLCVLDGEHIVVSAHDRGSRGAVVHQKQTVKRSLLIADDSLTTRTLLRNIMLSAGYDVETAVDGVDAWNKAQQRKFDCIMSDIEMPNMNGWEFCARVKRDGRLADTPLVLITSLSRDEERRRGLELGADAYIVKGLFNETQLLETVERLVA